MKKKVLVVDDEKDILELLKYNLEKEGYETICENNGEKVLEMVNKEKPDLIVLDLMLPELSGIEICKSLKRNDNLASIPVIMLTAKDTEADIIIGLELGADDYITKPFSPKVVIARIKSVLRRTKEKFAKKEYIHIADLEIDISKHKVIIKGKCVELTITEFRILEFFARHPGRVYTRDQILNNAWTEDSFVVDRTVDVHIRGLRKKMGKMADLIETVRGVGYRFREEI